MAESGEAGGGGSRNLVLAAMIFAVSMTFIDQTIVSIAAPEIQKELTYGEASGITQTVRNYSASLGLAILGTILVSQARSHLTASLISQGLSGARAHAEASRIAQFEGGASAGSIPHFVRLDFAYATRSVLYVMAAIMAAAALAALIGLRSGRQEETDTTVADLDGEALA